jgi:glycerol-3-phosphate O-acyltransferase
MGEAERLHSRLLDMERRGELYLSDELKLCKLQEWVDDGMTELGLLHEAAVVKRVEGAIWSEDMNLLYYYRNRLAGYGLSLLARPRVVQGKPGSNDPKGFLE